MTMYHFEQALSILSPNQTKDLELQNPTPKDVFEKFESACH